MSRGEEVHTQRAVNLLISFHLFFNICLLNGKFKNEKHPKRLF